MGEDLLPLAGIGADRQGRADMVENDGRLRKPPGKIGELRYLRMEKPGVEREAIGGQARIAFAERRIEQQAFREIPARPFDGRIGVPNRPAANAAKAIARGAQMRLENRVDFGAELKIGIADDAGADPRRSVEAAGAHRSDAIDELRFAKGRESRIAAGAIHRVALHEDGRLDPVARLDIRSQFVEKISGAAIPEMMVRIDDRQVGLDNLFAILLEPEFVGAE